jgi:hypothetical protein
MARIRTIHPEFWSTEQVIALSPLARLVFIGLWNFCDDAGRMPLSIRAMRMRIFPGDDVSSEAVEAMLDELRSDALGPPLIETYAVNGAAYLQIAGWTRDQKVNRPTYQFPDRHGRVGGRSVCPVCGGVGLVVPA